MYRDNEDIAESGLYGEGSREDAIRDPFHPRFWEDKLYHPWNGKPRGIFVCDMSDLFGIGIPEEWTRTVLDLCRKHEQNRYYLLTKQPQRLPEFSPFPENVYLGVTATNTDMLLNAVNCLEEVRARVKYISLEPLLSWADTSKWVYPLADSLKGLDWLIIGACTGNSWEMINLGEKLGRDDMQVSVRRFGSKWTLQPRIEWIREIVEAADRAGVKVFLKDNLLELVNYQSPETDFAFNKEGCYRQEMPE
jgi:hypothetical protein